MKIIDELLTKLPFAATELKDKTYTVSVPKEKLYETASFLKKNAQLSFDFLMDIVGMDYGDALGAIYYLSATQYPSYIIELKTSTADRENPQIDSVHDLWLSADLYEREVHDFFGITFVNNPDMRRLFL
ncbi:MAG: NADH-quinone oxidoreductase subunit C, partial [Candidatus Symbiothrix sp.]|nr:NADH-quinone oxidoreductase subunit C [Candidatus Symbiothrix sp.]